MAVNFAKLPVLLKRFAAAKRGVIAVPRGGTPCAAAPARRFNLGSIATDRTANTSSSLPRENLVRSAEPRRAASTCGQIPSRQRGSQKPNRATSSARVGRRRDNDEPANPVRIVERKGQRK